MKAYRKAYEDSFYGTDDASLVERMGLPVAVIEGFPQNIKITMESDLLVAEAMAKVWMV